MARSWTTYQITPQIRVGGGPQFRSSQTPIRNPGWSTESYVTADLMAEYAIEVGRIILKPNLSNVANKLYADVVLRALRSRCRPPAPGVCQVQILNLTAPVFQISSRF